MEKLYLVGRHSRTRQIGSTENLCVSADLVAEDLYPLPDFPRLRGTQHSITATYTPPGYSEHTAPNSSALPFPAPAGRPAGRATNASTTQHTENDESNRRWSLSHVRWDCKYHVVIVPKYRKRVLY